MVKKETNEESARTIWEILEACLMWLLNHPVYGLIGIISVGIFLYDASKETGIVFLQAVGALLEKFKVLENLREKINQFEEMMRYSGSLGMIRKDLVDLFARVKALEKQVYGNEYGESKEAEVKAP